MGDESGSAVFTLQDANQILEFWRDFDLESKRGPLDKQCVEMREMKTTSMNGRKHLNELTKTFRSKSRDEQLGMVTEVLKAYQEEIDQLGRRAKFSESAFYSLYKSIFEAPDPCRALDGLVGMLTSTSTNQLEIERLRSELAQYDQEFQQLKNQDITIRRLEDQLAEFRERIEDKVQEEVARRTGEVEEASANKVAECRELQRAAEKRLAAAVEAMRQAQGSADRAQTQLFEVSSQAEERTSALLAENAILAEANERVSARCVELESEAELSRQQAAQALAQAQAGGGPAGVGGAAALAASKSSGALAREEEASTLHALVSELRAELRRKEEAFRTDRAKLDAAAREASTALAREREAGAKLRVELGERPRKEELSAARRQLKVLQRVAFNVEEDEGDDGDTDDPEKTSERAQLEALLTTRLKSLEAELAEARSARESSHKAEAAAKARADDASAKLEASAALVARLESDLEAAQRSRAGPGAGVGGSGVGGSLGLGPASGAGALGGSLGVGSIGSGGGVGGDFGSLELSELLGVSSTSALSVSGPGAGAGVGMGAAGASQRPDGQVGQMIGILQAQRDRYKTRLATAEANALQLQQTVTTLTAARKQAEEDNLALYAKIRFLQSKDNGGGGSSALSPQPLRIRMAHAGNSSRLHGGGPGGDASGTSADLEGHYGEMYEQKLNPFAEFSQRERQRRLEQLSVGDRVVFSTLSSLIAHKWGRSFLLVYLGCMHLFLMCVIWWLTHRVHHGCDPSLDHAVVAAAAARAGVAVRAR